jgi:hypothetical protein
MGAYESTSTTIVPDAKGIVYVKKSSTGDGSSWNNAAGELADALYAAATNTSIHTIWVAQGTYNPIYPADSSSADPRDRAFVLPDNVSVWGGFPANSSNGTNMSHWNWQTYPTILSGYLGQINNQHTYTYHVVIAAGSNSTVPKYMNGFTIEYGQAFGTGTMFVNGHSVHRNNGGGIYVIASNAYFADLIVLNCQANNFGGGMYNMSSILYMENIWAMKNTANYGGGIYSEDIPPSSSAWKHISIIENHAKVHGGGMYNREHSNMFLSCYICGNKADAQGSAIFNSANASPVYHNALIAQNEITASSDGGACIFNDNHSSPQFNNITVVSCLPDGVGMFNDQTCHPNLCNSIIWSGNLLPGGQQAVVDPDNTVTYQHCLIQNMQPAGNNLPGGTNPDFINPVYTSNYTANYGNYHLMASSRCIDWGDNSCATVSTGDLDQNQRILGKVDLGCYEFNPSNPTPSNNPYHKSTRNENIIPQEDIVLSNVTLTVYPNPSASGQQPSLLLGDGRLHYEGEIDVKVYSLEGKQLHNKVYSTGNVTLDMPQLSAGMYLVSVQTQEGKTYTAKLVISR